MNTSGGSTLAPHTSSVSPTANPTEAVRDTNATRTVRVGNARVQHSIEGWQIIEKIVSYVHAICRVSQVPRATLSDGNNGMCGDEEEILRGKNSSNPLSRLNGTSLSDLRDTESDTVAFSSGVASASSTGCCEDPSIRPRSLGSAILISIPNMSQMLVGSSDDDEDDEYDNNNNTDARKERRGGRRKREHAAGVKLSMRKVTLPMDAGAEDNGKNPSGDDTGEGESDTTDDDFNTEEITGVLITTTAVLPQELATSDKRAMFLEQPVEGSAAVWGKATVPVSVRIYEEKTFFDSVVLPRAAEKDTEVSATNDCARVARDTPTNGSPHSTEEGARERNPSDEADDVRATILKALEEDPLLNIRPPPPPPPRQHAGEHATEKSKKVSENALGFVIAQCDIFDDNCCCPIQHRQNSPYQRKNHFKRHTVSSTLARVRPLPLPLLLTNVPTVNIGDTHLMVTHINAVDRHYIVLKVKAVLEHHCEYELFDPYCDFSSGGPIFTQSGDFVGLQHQLGDVVYGLRITSIVRHLFQTMALGLCRIAIRGGGAVMSAGAGISGTTAHVRRSDSIGGGDSTDAGIGGATLDDLLWHNRSTYRFSQQTAPSMIMSQNFQERTLKGDRSSRDATDFSSTTTATTTTTTSITGTQLQESGGTDGAWRDHSKKLLERDSVAQELDQKTMLVGVAGDFVIDYEDFHRLRLRQGFKKRTVPPTLAVPHFMEVWNEWCRDLRSVLGLMYVFDYQVDIAILALRTVSNHDTLSGTNAAGMWNTEQNEAASSTSALERVHEEENAKEDNVVARVESVIRLGGVQIVLEIMDLHRCNVELVEAALCVLASVSISRPGKDALLHEQGVVSILEAMQLHASASKVQQWGCYTLRNLLSFNHVDGSGEQQGDQKHSDGMAWENDDELSRLEGVEQFQLFGGISHILRSLQLNMEHHELQHLVAWGFDLVASAIQQESGDDVELLMCAVEAGALPLIVKAAELYDKEMMVIQSVLALMRTLCCSGILSTTEKVVDIVGAQLASVMEFQQNGKPRSRVASESLGTGVAENQIAMLTTQDLNRVLLQPTPRTSHMFDSQLRDGVMGMEEEEEEAEASTGSGSSSSESDDDGWFELDDWVTNIADVIGHAPTHSEHATHQGHRDLTNTRSAERIGTKSPPAHADEATTHVEQVQPLASHASAASHSKSGRSRSYFQSTTDSLEPPSRLDCSTRAASHASPLANPVNGGAMDEETQLQIATSAPNVVERHIISASCIGALSTSFDLVYWLCGILYLVEEERRYPRVAQYSMDVLWAVFVYTTLPKSVKKYAKVLGLRRLVERAPTSFPSDDGVARAASCIIHELDRLRKN